MAQPPGRSRRRARGRRRHRALAQAHRRARARPRLRHLARGPAAGHALRGRSLCALRAREDAARGDRVLAHRTVLAGDHRRAHRRHAEELRLRHRRDARLFLASGRRRRSAIPISRSTTSSATRRRRSSSSRCWRRWNSNATCCGRCSTRCTMPMSRRSTFRPAPSCRRMGAARERSEPGHCRRAQAAAAARRAAGAQRGAGRLGAARAGARVQGRRDRGRDRQALHRRGDVRARSSTTSPRPSTRRASGSSTDVPRCCAALADKKLLEL